MGGAEEMMETRLITVNVECYDKILDLFSNTYIEIGDAIATLLALLVDIHLTHEISREVILSTVQDLTQQILDARERQKEVNH